MVRKSDNKLAVVKIIRKRNYSLNVLEKLNYTLQSILSSKIDHPNCVPIIETFATKHYAYIVMEMCKGGELFDAITEEVI